MRITLISPPWLTVPPVGYGGTERVIDTLARVLVDAGHDVVLLATGDSTCPVPRRATLPRAVGSEQASPVMELRNVIAAYQHARDAGADVVHDHTLVGPFFARRFPWLPVVTTNHGPFDGDLAEVYRAMTDLVPVVSISELLDALLSVERLDRRACRAVVAQRFTAAQNGRALSDSLS